jgi:hypothetical protein
MKTDLPAHGIHPERGEVLPPEDSIAVVLGKRDGIPIDKEEVPTMPT